MAQKIVTSIRRTGTVASPTRQIVVVQGTGRKSVETVLSTPIEKIEMGLSFRNGGARTPIEQYAFRVGTKTVERFADATALVLKKHHIALDDMETAQTYVKKAFKILTGQEDLRTAEIS